MDKAYRSIDEVILPVSNITFGELLCKMKARSGDRIKEYLNLSGLDLHDVDLSSLNLSHAILWNTNLCGANLQYSNLSYANIYHANLSYANLDYATCKHTEIFNSSLRKATMRCASFQYASFHSVDLNNIKIDNTDFMFATFFRSSIIVDDVANFSYATFNECGTVYTGNASLYSCGIIVDTPIRGYKKCYTGRGDSAIVTLEIPRGAIVFSISGGKCRTNKAIVLSIDTNETDEVHSSHDPEFTYRVGDELVVDDFDLRYNVECSTGIHFFLTKEEAEEYVLSNPWRILR